MVVEDGAVLELNRDLSVNSTFDIEPLAVINWSSGSLNGTYTLTNNGTINFNAGGNINLSGGATINNNNQINMNGIGEVNLNGANLIIM